jgi:8-oxo-dGTP pyrophosphatase MutT (NUDIX family)
MSWKPDITVAAIVERAQRFLIVEERIGGKLVFNQPAGHVENDESLIAAVIRETREETGCEFVPAALVGVYNWRKPGGRKDTLRFAFAGSAASPAATAVLDHPIIATHWLTRHELQARTAALRSPLVLRCVDDYLSGLRHPLTLVSDLRTLV